MHSGSLLRRMLIIVSIVRHDSLNRVPESPCADRLSLTIFRLPIEIISEGPICLLPEVSITMLR